MIESDQLLGYSNHEINSFQQWNDSFPTTNMHHAEYFKDLHNLTGIQGDQFGRVLGENFSKAHLN